VPRRVTSDQILECYRRAAEASHFAATSHNPREKADMLEVMQGWLRLSRNYEPKDEARSTGGIVRAGRRLTN
jgi:hypothetical protein